VKTELWPLERLIDYARNPRKNDHAVDRVAAAIKEFGFRVPIVAKSDGLVVDGHLRLKAARKLGLAEVPVVLADDLTDAQVKAFRLSVNRMAELAEWDSELLALELGELGELGFDLDLTGFSGDDLAQASSDGAEKAGDLDGDTYTKKIKAPIYEPKGEKPKVSELFDNTKTIELVKEIDAAGLPKEVAAFLRLAAERHTVFNFRNIAEFYAHSDEKVQNLFERSALVIIDFDKAIENGFVRMTERLGKLADSEGFSDEG
jgi:hypothetical protein